MTREACSESDFIELLRTIGPTETAKRLKISTRCVFLRRNTIEAKTGRKIEVKDGRRITEDRPPPAEYPGRIALDLDNGVVLVGSDAHYWPGVVSTAHRAFVRSCKELKPAIVVMNGDVFDGASVSRHEPIMWEKKPTVIEELEACQERLGEIEKAAFKAQKIWPLGNHDARFETRLATAAPEYAKVKGFHLKDHVAAAWTPCWSVWINDSVVIKHRYKGGIHAPWNNTMNAGKTIVTGHLHSLKSTPLTDYNGTRYGVDTGTLAETFGPQFEYLEDNPRNWRAGFAVLTFQNGILLPPELVTVMDDGVVAFRGKLYEV